jgi:ABC-type multidrug transport system fused ATPase/permease subunit
MFTIAHRINTILDSDRVIVMDDGRVAEFGPTARLRDDPASLFHGFVQKGT